jgi:AcrR family transcriptional regulator
VRIDNREAAGVNKRMLYHYFASKDGLLAAVLDDRLAAGRARRQAVVGRPARRRVWADQIRLQMWEALAVERQPAPAAPWQSRVADIDAGSGPVAIPRTRRRTTRTTLLLSCCSRSRSAADPMITGMSPPMSVHRGAIGVSGGARIAHRASRRAKRKTSLPASGPRYRVGAVTGQIRGTRGAGDRRGLPVEVVGNVSPAIRIDDRYRYAARRQRKAHRDAMVA